MAAKNIMMLYNSLSRSKQILSPKDGSKITMYVCGLTVYDRPHLGHALSAVVFDTLHRFLEWKGMTVVRVHNFTDIDDKIIARARELDISHSDLAERNIEAFFEGMDALNVRRADIHPRATENIPYIVDMISALIEKGTAYRRGRNVYFRVAAFPKYGQLSGRNTEDMLENVRGVSELDKEEAADFALWKAHTEGEPFWESPWGNGRPGWHIECSAMAHRYLGESIDIHGGGMDLIFPHHENEIAQSEAFSSRPFVKFWVHNGLISLPDGEKMSKSLGNGTYVEEVLSNFSADAVRLWMLQSHYRSPLLLDLDNIGKAEKAVERLRNVLKSPVGAGERFDASPFITSFSDAMSNDLATPSAIAVLFDFRRALGQASSMGLDIKDGLKTMRELAEVLGLTLQGNPIREKQARGNLDLSMVEKLVSERDTARRERRFADADRLRDELSSVGVVLKDSSEGTVWNLGGDKVDNPLDNNRSRSYSRTDEQHRDNNGRPEK